MGQKGGKRLIPAESKTVNDSSQSQDNRRLSISYEFSPAHNEMKPKNLTKTQNKRNKKSDEKDLLNDITSTHNNFVVQGGGGAHLESSSSYINSPLYIDLPLVN